MLRATKAARNGWLYRLFEGSGIIIALLVIILAGCSSKYGGNESGPTREVSIYNDKVTASRIFAGPNEYPPKQFAAYGILAFRSRPTPYDRGRHVMFCHTYLAVLPHESELDVPRSKQIVTVWPIDSDEAADRLNRRKNKIEEVCQRAVYEYGLVIAQQALKDAELTGRSLSGPGPYLLAWSPAAAKGKEDALVLVSDLSDITTYEQAHERFLAWSRDIESDPGLWSSGWDLQRLRVHIRSWVDKYGERALAVLVR